MYREAGELPYGPLAKRLGAIWRVLGVLAGAVAIGAGGFVSFWVVATMLQRELRGADRLVPGVLPVCVGLVVYGIDLAWRAIRVRSTDRSAFEGRLGRRRAVVGTIAGAYVLLYTLAVTIAVGTVEPGIDLFLGVMALLGLSLTVGSVRGLLRPRARAPKLFVAEEPVALRVAQTADDPTPRTRLEEATSEDAIAVDEQSAHDAEIDAETTLRRGT